MTITNNNNHPARSRSAHEGSACCGESDCSTDTSWNTRSYRAASDPDMFLEIDVDAKGHHHSTTQIRDNIHLSSSTEAFGGVSGDGGDGAGRDGDGMCNEGNEDGDMAPELKLQTRIVEHIGFAQALEAQQPKLWTKAMGKLYFFLMVASICSLMNAYNTTLVGTVGSIDYYNKFFYDDETKSSLVMSVYAIGNIAGSFVCGPFADWWGRRWGMFSGAVVLFIGSMLQGSAQNMAIFIGGRFLLGFGIALCQTSGTCYVAEMAHPAWRGPITGLYNSLWNLGAIPACFSPYITKHLHNNLQWRLPLYFQAVGAGTLIVASLFIPETPRWLFANGKREMAVRVLEKYHGEGNRKSPIVMLTYRELVQEIFIEGSDKRWWDYTDLFNSKAAWWRNSCVMGLAFISQMNGAGMITFYLPRLTKSAGITGQIELLNTSLVLGFSLIAAITGALLVDRIGRRRSLLIGSSLLVVWWTLMTVLMSQFAGEGGASKSGARATVAFLSIFSITYSFSFTPLQVLYPVECLSFETRAKGMGVSNLIGNLGSFFNTYAVTPIMKDIGWRFYGAYLGLNVLYTVFMYYFFIETRGRTLEEINEIFKAPYPKNKSLERHKMVISDFATASQWGLELENLNEEFGSPSNTPYPSAAPTPRMKFPTEISDIDALEKR